MGYNPENILDLPFEVEVKYFPTMPFRLKRLPTGHISISGRNRVQKKGWAVGLKEENIKTPEALAQKVMEIMGMGFISPQDLKKRKPLDDQGVFAGLESITNQALQAYWMRFEEAMVSLFGEMGYWKEGDDPVEEAPKKASDELFG